MMASSTMRRLWLLLIMLSCSSCSPVRTPSQSNAFPNLETESCNRLKSLYKKHGRPSAWMGNCDFVQWLVTRKRARVVVDLGVDYGFSTFAFASAMADDGGACLVALAGRGLSVVELSNCSLKTHLC